MGTGHVFVTVTTTLDDADKARELALKLVESRLAACVQRVPIASTYRWQGTIEQADETLLIAKTRQELAEQLTELIKREHSYEVPEIVISPILGGSDAYLKWIRDMTEV